MRRRSKTAVQLAIGQRCSSGFQTHRKFDPENSRHRIVDTRHRYAILAHELKQRIVKFTILHRDHEHVHARICRSFDLRLVITGHLVDRVVIGDQKTVELKLAFQDLRQESFAAGTLHSVPTAVRRHDRADTRFDRTHITRHVNVSEFLFTDRNVAAIEYVYITLQLRAGAEFCTAVANEMLRAREYAQRIAQVVSLVSAHGSLAHHARELGRLAETFVSSAPTLVTWHSHARRESPVNTGGPDFGRSDASRAFDEVRIARTAETDVVWEKDGAEHVVVAVHRVDTVKQRDTQTCVLRARLETIVVIGPVNQSIPRLRIGAAATEH